MKAAQLTPAATPAKKNSPFFSKGGKQEFFHSSIKELPFFSKTKNNNYGIQTKLTIGAPNDVYEKEADAMADKVVQRLAQPEVISKKDQSVQAKPLSTSFTPLVQKKCAHCEEEEKLQKEKEHKGKERIQKKPIFESDVEPPDEDKKIQRKCAECEKEEKLQKKSNESSPASPSNIESCLSSSKGGGSTLPAATLEQMEGSFGADFSNVRIHNDSSAVQMSRDLNAQAFTHGGDIYFNSGKYDPNSKGGKHLLAHELTHTVQQGKVSSNRNAMIHKYRNSNSIQMQGNTGGKLPALSPNELMNFMLSQRGFGTSKPGTLSIDPAGIGKPTGKGYQTYAAIQIVDKEGNQIKVSVGAYLSGKDMHGETQAISALRNSLTEGIDLKGSKMVVVVEQFPCANCDSAIKNFAKEIGVSEYSIYVPARSSLTKPGELVKPKTAATSAFQGGRGPTTARLLSSEVLQESKTISSELAEGAKIVAKEAIASLETDLKILKFSKYLTMAFAILDGISSILTAVDFINMSESKLENGTFMMNDYVVKAKEMDADADKIAQEYPNISEKLNEMQLNLIKAIYLPENLGNVILGVLDFKLQISKLQETIDNRISFITSAKKEADAKHDAAISILNSHTSSGLIGGLSFGTAQLATLFAASQDLEQISGIFTSTLSTLQKVEDSIKEDIYFLQQWYDSLLSICNNDPTCKKSLEKGFYNVIIVSAQLPDSLLDTPDAYVYFPRNGLKTSIKDDTTTPVWNEVIGSWRIDRLEENIKIEIYDSDLISSDDLLGSFDANLKPHNPEGENFTLKNADITLIIKVQRELYDPNNFE